MTNLSTKIKQFRKGQNLTQEQFADELGIKKSLLGAYEEARATPPIDKLLLLANVMELSLDQLVAEETEPVAKSANLQKLSGTTKLVSKEHLTAYCSSFNDPSFLLQLEDYSFPLNTKGEYRAFQGLDDVSDSSLVVIAAFKQDLEPDSYYVLLTKNELIYRQYHAYKEAKNAHLFSSDLEGVAPIEIKKDSLIEIWKVEAYFSNTPPENKVNTQKAETLIKELQLTLNLK